MGSWNETCGLSNLPITPGDEVVFLLLTKNPYDDHIGRSGCYHTDFFFVRSIPLYGAYDDYGRVAIHKGQDKAIDLIKRGFAMDLIPQPADKCRHGPIFMDTWTIDNLQEWLHEGKVRIDKNALSRESDMRMAAQMAKLVGETPEGDPKSAARAEMSQKAAKMAKAREKAVPSPIYKLIIRRDVWDAFLSVESKTWYGNYGLTTYKAGADEVLAAYTKQLGEVKSELDKLADFKSVRNLLLHGEISDRNNIFVSRYLSVGGGGDPPFEVSNKWYCDQMVDLLFDGTLTTADVQDIFYRMAELAQVEHVMAMTRRAWMPTTGMGSQSEETELAMEVFMKLAKVTESVILKGIEDQREWDEDEAEETARRFEILKNRLNF